MKNKKTLSEEEKLKLYEFFEKSLMTWPGLSVNILESCRHLDNQIWFIKDLVEALVNRKDLFLQVVPTEKQDLEKVFFAKESIDEIRKIFWQYDIDLGVLLEPPSEIIAVFFEKYPQYKKPPL